MTNPPPTRPLPPRSHLLTRAQVIQRLREERGMLGLSNTAAKYSIAPQQLCDVLAGRSALSKRMAERIGLVIWTLYERKAE